ncbi:programmed cell death protein 7 [Ceratina calcarata]|uniref:Programmed cell death protein 7 n=1 Tax=Ceratina calcarata TaxID=156304 RepID=A0AAJ7IUR4_9HYME|nr:programmed cell death protein 7 [Ceratina calcarata]
MFAGQSSTGESMQHCGYSHYDTINPSVYNMNYNLNVYHNYICPIDTSDKTATSMSNTENRRIDERNIEHFLQETDQSDNKNDQRNTWRRSKIAYAKNAITSIYKLNERLKRNCAELQNYQNLTEEEWQEKMSVCSAAKEEILKLLEPIKSESCLKQLKRDLERRKRKRLREKVKKEKWNIEKLARTERRARMHAQIDSWIRKEQAVIEKERQEENLRKDADMVLFDVRGKRSDAKKYLGLLQELKNLRNVKVNIARARGEHLSSAADEAFNNILEKLTEQWSKLDREYSIEEQGLKLMLKTDNEERIEKQTRSLFDDWEKVLFGKKISDQCNMDLTNFVAIRTAWDKYISAEDDASAIPIGWVMPIKPTSAAWQKCLRKEIS